MNLCLLCPHERIHAGAGAENLFSNFYSKAAFQVVAHGTFQGGMAAISGGKFWSGFAAGAASSIASSAFGFDGSTSDDTTLGFASGFRSSGAGMIIFGTVVGGTSAALTKGNFWQGAVTGLVVSGLNDFAHQIKIKNDVESKYPGLYSVLSKLKTYVKDHPSILESMSLFSGYSNKEVLNLLSLRNLVNVVKVGGTSEWGQFFKAGDNKYIHISKNLVSSLDIGGFDYTKFKIFENVNGRSFLAGVTILHELVHYGRYWNGLPSLVGKYEAGQMFEKRVFGIVNGINGSSKNAATYDWKF